MVVPEGIGPSFSGYQPDVLPLDDGTFGTLGWIRTSNHRHRIPVPSPIGPRVHDLDLAARQGFEPRFPDSESGVLPLDDRAGPRALLLSASPGTEATQRLFVVDDENATGPLCCRLRREL